MRFQITDVGRIRKADIKLDGITVIAGENNTGKSTVGKALFAYANADGDLERNIKEEVAAEIQLAMLLLSSMVSGGILVLCVLSSI